MLYAVLDCLHCAVLHPRLACWHNHLSKGPPHPKAPLPAFWFWVQVDWRLLPAGAYGAGNTRFVSGCGSVGTLSTPRAGNCWWHASHEGATQAHAAARPRAVALPASCADPSDFPPFILPALCLQRCWMLAAKTGFELPQPPQPKYYVEIRQGGLTLAAYCCLVHSAGKYSAYWPVAAI